MRRSVATAGVLAFTALAAACEPEPATARPCVQTIAPDDHQAFDVWAERHGRLDYRPDDFWYDEAGNVIGTSPEEDAAICVYES